MLLKITLYKMDKKLFSFLFSTRLMAFLFIAFAAAMASILVHNLQPAIQYKWELDTHKKKNEAY